MSKKKKSIVPYVVGYSILGFAVFCFVLFMCFYFTGALNNTSDPSSSLNNNISHNTSFTENPTVENQETSDSGLPSTNSEALAISLPCMLQDGTVEIESVFSYSGSNPDNSWKEGNSIGAAVVRNSSEQYLESLDLSITLSDGSVLQFQITALPSGESVCAFDLNNTTYDAASYVVDIHADSVFNEEQGIPSEIVSVSVSGMEVSLTNESTNTLGNLLVYCRTKVEDTYFGGKAYVYSVEGIDSNDQAVVMAYDCLLGSADVICVDYAK